LHDGLILEHNREDFMEILESILGKVSSMIDAGSSSDPFLGGAYNLQSTSATPKKKGLIRPTAVSTVTTASQLTVTTVIGETVHVAI